MLYLIPIEVSYKENRYNIQGFTILYKYPCFALVYITPYVGKEGGWGGGA
jgi:hypothetical protein